MASFDLDSAEESESVVKINDSIKCTEIMPSSFWPIPNLHSKGVVA